MKPRHIMPSEIAAFFSVEDNYVSQGEFREFWKSLSDTDKEYYRQEVTDWIYKKGAYA